mmetsp:Transcript_2540/g.7754  ORF Transcript_2540/g.7754 Transcript_2540/m.7754 type:complete len:226 (-) Transcript_2540:1718-2395(-)
MERSLEIISSTILWVRFQASASGLSLSIPNFSSSFFHLFRKPCLRCLPALCTGSPLKLKLKQFWKIRLTSSLNSSIVLYFLLLWLFARVEISIGHFTTSWYLAQSSGCGKISAVTGLKKGWAYLCFFRKWTILSHSFIISSSFVRTFFSVWSLDSTSCFSQLCLKKTSSSSPAFLTTLSSFLLYSLQLLNTSSMSALNSETFSYTRLASLSVILLKSMGSLTISK